MPDGLIVAAIVAVNAVGDVIDPATGKVVAGIRTADGKGFADARALLRAGGPRRAGGAGENTTIGVIATNAALTKTQATRVAQMAHDGYARAISPSHTPNDGDAIFAIATGAKTGDANAGTSRRARRGSDGRCHRPRRPAGHRRARLSRHPRSQVNLPLVVLSVYSLGLMALGLWIGRRVRERRRLSRRGPTTRSRADLFNDARREHRRRIDRRRDGAGLPARRGRVVVGRIGGDRIAGARVLDRAGDAPGRGAPRSAQRRRLPRVPLQSLRSARSSSVLLWIGTTFILASQLIGLAAILILVAGVPAPIGCAVGGAVVTVYFIAGGLLTSARVNVVQLAVKMAGFAIAVPLVLGAAGGWNALRQVQAADGDVLDVLARGRRRRLPLRVRAGVRHLAWTAAEGPRRARRSRRPRRRRTECARTVSLRRRSGPPRHRLPGDVSAADRQPAGAADGADPGVAAASRRDRRRGGLLGGNQRCRRRDCSC